MPHLAASEIVDEAAIKALTTSAKELEIRVAQKMTIREALFEVARLGGFLGRKADGDPGMKSILKGWQRLPDHQDFFDSSTFG